MAVIVPWRIYGLPDFIARVVQIFIQLTAGLLRIRLCVMQSLAAILPELLGGAPGVFTGLAGLFMGSILIRPGARPQTRCKENNHCVSHGS